ncbi:MAG TPA: hypothetical protein VES36_10380 [Candidatus Limnocylindrales bacterium]|nr:hypothetical protein [Candidatus Limnocylindrales bacterium]
MHRRVAAQRAALVAVALLAATTSMTSASPAGLGTLPSADAAYLDAQTERSGSGADARGPHPTPSEPNAPVVRGTASTYTGTAGYVGRPSVALPGPLGGRYTGAVTGYVTVCADRCARLAVVDWCDCHWGSNDQRVIDLSHAAWPLVTDQPLSAGLVQVRVILSDPQLASVWRQADDPA